MSSAGLQQRAMAIMARWRIPPDRVWGYFFITACASGIPTLARIDSARAAASSLDKCRCLRMLSVIWLPTVNTGFKEVIGSWKIMVMRFPRMSSSSFSVISRRFLPSNRTEPSMTAPPLPNKPIIDSEVTLFPQPDSPTIQTTSPSST